MPFYSWPAWSAALEALQVLGTDQPGIANFDGRQAPVTYPAGDERWPAVLG